MRHLPAAARYLLGVVLFVFGLNGFVPFMPPPPTPPPAAGGAFLDALAASGYLMTLVKAVEVTVGVLLLANRFVPLALVLFAPVAVNIALYHAVFDTAVPGMVVALLVLALEVFLLVAYRGHYAPLAHARTAPTHSPVGGDAARVRQPAV